MAATYLQGSELPLLLSDDNWTTTYTLSCLVSTGLKLGYSITTEENQCGIATGVGSVSFSIPFSAHVNATPDAVVSNAGQVSFKQMQDWVKDRELLKFKLFSGASGVDFYSSGDVYLNDLNLESQLGSVIKMSGTLTGTGVLDTTFA